MSLRHRHFFGKLGKFRIEVDAELGQESVVAQCVTRSQRRRTTHATPIHMDKPGVGLLNSHGWEQQLDHALIEEQSSAPGRLEFRKLIAERFERLPRLENRDFEIVAKRRSCRASTCAASDDYGRFHLAPPSFA